jgi:RNA polymerase sigma factor (TIGR02999 family)
LSGAESGIGRFRSVSGKAKGNSLARLIYQADNSTEKLPRKRKGCREMSQRQSGVVTKVLQAAKGGDQEAVARLLPLLYSELHRLAQARMAKLRPGQTLQPTALINEAYLRLMAKKDLHLENRKHFFFAAARAMRDILVERARAKAGPKRGGDRRRVALSEAIAIDEPPAQEVLALHEALAELERQDPLKSQIVQLRYFAGMQATEVAQVLGISERTLHRHWRFIKAWMKNRLEKE